MADLSASNVTSIDGNVDHDAVDAGQPVKVGGRAYSGTPTAVSDQDRTDAWFGTRGQLAAMLVDNAGVPMATGSQYTEDAALGAVGTGIGTLLIGRAAASAPTSVSADADAVGLWASRFGALNVILRDTAGGFIGGVSAGDVAHDGVDAGNPVKIGGYASTASPTAVSADGDRVNAWFTRRGSLTVELRDDGGNQPSLLTWSNADAQVVANVTGMSTLSQLWAFNGTTADRLRTVPGVTGALAAGGLTASDAVLAAAPLTIGGRASNAAPTAMSADGDVVDARFTRTGALNVFMVDQAGAAASVGGGTQYVGDAAATATPTGTIAMALANTTGPTDVSAANDAVALWATPKGALNVVLRDATGNAIATSFPADALSNSNVGAAVLGLGAVYNGTTWDRLRAAVGVTGSQAVGGPTASDAVLAAAPVTIGGRASNAAPTAMSADGDVVDARFTRTGALNVYMVDQAGAAASLGGGTQYASDVAMGTATGTVAMARASSPVPGSVSTDGDAVPLWATGSGALVVDGGVAQDAVDSGNPVKVGGYAKAAAPAAVSADGDRVNAWFGLRGDLKVSLVGTGSGISEIATPADAVSNGVNALQAETFPLLYNGTTWDRARTVQGVATGANTDLGIGAAGVGPGYSRVPADDALASVTAGAAIDVGGASVVALQVTGGATATITFEASYDGSTYFAVSAQNQSTAIWSTTTTANGNFLIPVQGYYRVRANMTARTSGTFTVHKIVHFGQVFNQVSGDVAHDGVDSGNPVKIAGKASATPFANVASNDRANVWVGLPGQMMVGNIIDTTSVGADAVNMGRYLLPDGNAAANPIGAGGHVFNGTTWDRARGAVGVTGSQAIGGPTASDGVLAAAPITIGARASTAIPTAVSADGDVVDLRALRTGALTVHMVDATGAAASIGGGTQYVGDAAATATPTGTMSMGLANTSAPTDVSAANDAVALWVSPKGALNVTLRDTAGAAILTGVQYVEDAAITSAAGQGTYIVGRGSAATPTAVSTDGDAVGAWFTKDGRQVVDGGIASDAADTGNPIKIGGRARTSVITAVANNDRVDAIYTTFGAQSMAIYDHFGNGSAVVTAAGDGLSATDAGLRTNSVLLGYNGATNDSIRTSPGVTGTLSVGGRTAADAALTIAPLTMGGRASTAVPTAMSADGDVVDMWMTRNGAQVVTISDSSGNGTAATAGSVDAVGNTATALLVQTRPTLFNGASWDRARSIEALSTAPNADTGIPAVGTGPGWDRKRTASAMAVTLNAATTLVVNGAATVTFAFKFNTVTVGTGTLIFEVAADDVTPTWVTAPTVMKMPEQTAVAGTFTPATGTQYMVSVAGWRQVRVRVAAALTSGTIDVLTTGSAADAILTLADRQRVVSYGAVFRLAEAATSLALSFTHVANTTKQYATLHHAATALKLVKIRKVTFWLYSTSAALDGVLELRRITAAPATGNPAITPAAHDPAAPAAEVTCLALPTTAGTEAAVNSPVASIGLNLGITAANTSGSGPIPFVLFDADKYTDMQALNIRPLTLEGWAVDLRTVGTPVVKALIEVQLTEE